MVKVVVIGDVSWAGKYHLGDEAMSEVAVTQLRNRGALVTLIAGDPKIATERYKVDSVPRFGYRELPQRAQKDRKLRAIERGLLDDSSLPVDVVDTVRAIQEADAVIIAGGGNMNSDGVHHLYDRLTAKRIAESIGVPLYVTSQTVGPHLLKADRDIVVEIAEYARVFGAREETTASLLRLICSDSVNIVRSLDDAYLLEPSESQPLPPSSEISGNSYVVASFTFHAWSTALSRDEYYLKLAKIVDHIVEICDVDVLLLPHMGSLEKPDTLEADLLGHSRIAELSKSHRVRSSNMVSASGVVKLTAGAEFTISTRYHPVVFGPSVSVSSIGLITSYYSAIRMRGALKNVGMESIAIPFESWEPSFAEPLLEALINQRDKFVTHLDSAKAVQRLYQLQWWDGIWSDINQNGSVVCTDAVNPIAFEWASEMGRELLKISRSAHEGINKSRLDNSFELKSLKARISNLEKKQQAMSSSIVSTSSSIADLERITNTSAGSRKGLVEPVGDQHTDLADDLSFIDVKNNDRKQLLPRLISGVIWRGQKLRKRLR